QKHRSAVLPPSRTSQFPPSRSHLSLQIAHPAAYAHASDAEYSPLEAPALPFSSSGSPRRSRTRSTESTGSNLHTRPTSSQSLPSLAVTSSPSRSSHPPSTNSAESLPSTASRRDMHGRGLSDAQEELLVEARSDRENGTESNPYAWERPLDSVNRHSRMLDSFPLTTTSEPNGRRVSRLPPGVQMLDPFGFSLAAETSPYDLALNASSPTATPGVLSPSRSPVRTSFLQPQLTSTSVSTSSHGHSHFPSSSSIASNLSNTSTAATTPTLQPWNKPRAASAGEVYQLNSRAQIKNGLLGPPTVQRGASSRSRLSKLSGEIDAETMSIASTATKSQLPAFVPADSDYLNSKLYARTLKAQKALEKEREKAASKGKMSRYDSEAAKSTSSLAVPRASTDTGRPASIMSVASAGKVRLGRRSGLGWFKSNSEVALSPPIPDPPTPSPPLPSSRSSTALPIGPRPTSSSVHPPSPQLISDPALRSAHSSSDYLREARESVAAQKAPPMSSRQTSGGSSSSSGEQELVRPGPIPIRKSRASPSGSFQHSPTIRESSPPTTPTLEITQASLTPLPPSVVSSPHRNSSLETQSRTRPESTTPTPIMPTAEPVQQSSHLRSHESSRPTPQTSNGPTAPQSSSRPAQALPNGVSSGPPPTAPPATRFPQPPQPSQGSRAAEIPFPTASSASPGPSAHRSRPVERNPASVVPPPLLTPDASLANGAEVGVKRRKSSLGLLFGGGSSRTPKSSPTATVSPALPTVQDRTRQVRRPEERSRTESKPVMKEKVKDKVKESFFGRVKRPDIPEPKPTPAPSASAPRTRPQPTSSVPPLLAGSPQSKAPRPPPGAQPPAPPYSQSNGHSSNTRPTQPHEIGEPEKASRAPDSSSSASTEFSTLSSSSSTLPPTPSSGRSTNGLSKSTNGPTPKANGGGSAFSNFFGRNRTKSLGANTNSPAAKLSRSKNATPTPEDDRKHMPVLPSRGNFVDRMTPLKKPSRAGGPPPQAFPGVENYAPPTSSNPTEIMVTSAHRGYPTYA
ncbi:hypothetical protein JCM16303_007398, partial [Sporobolomyces ruberrimus]